MSEGPVIDSLSRLASELRARGATLGVGEVLRAHRALGAVDPADRRQAYLALRAALCSSRDDVRHFDSAFAALFGAPHSDAPGLDPTVSPALARTMISAPDSQSIGPETDLPAAASDIELLRDKDFADYTDAERACARALVARIAQRRPTRRGRRARPVRHGSIFDQRATLRASMRHAGEPLQRRWREHVERPRPLVLICDVSGSMEPYARMLLAYAHACVQARGDCETFAFATKLTRITRELGERDPDAAISRAAARAGDWSSGTRIGDALANLNREHGRRVGRGAVVAILSDGWDTGEPEVLEREVARLARCSRRLIWLNPLKASPGYEPLVRGMNAALPHVDLFLSGNTLGSLEELAEANDSGSEPRSRALKSAA